MLQRKVLGVQNHISPQNYPSRTAALREQQLMVKIDGYVHGLGKKSRKRQEGSSWKLEIAVMTGDMRVWRFQEVQRVRE